jgi:CobQ-like glutamine amidotransferase family enzyme
MDTYGDKGNIITLVKRCQWRGIEANVTNISVNQSLSLAPRSSAQQSEVGTFHFDLFFFGGGQDRQQIIVGKDLQKKAKGLKAAIDNGAVMLSICGGYQLLQNYFKTIDGEVIKGIGLFDAHTIGSTTRMIQNLWIDLDENLKNEIGKSYPTTDNGQLTTDLIGFENHSGKTFLGSGVQPLGKVLKGAGNNGEDQTEGAIFKNAFGCYLHGSLLPKNPHFADYLISKALERRYGMRKLVPLDDSIEWEAHKSAVKRSRSRT